MIIQEWMAMGCQPAQSRQAQHGSEAGPRSKFAHFQPAAWAALCKPVWTRPSLARRTSAQGKHADLADGLLGIAALAAPAVPEQCSPKSLGQNPMPYCGICRLRSTCNTPTDNQHEALLHGRAGRCAILIRASKAGRSSRTPGGLQASIQPACAPVKLQAATCFPHMSSPHVPPSLPYLIASISWVDVSKVASTWTASTVQQCTWSLQIFNVCVVRASRRCWYLASC